MEGYLRALRIIKPRAFLLENVAGLAYDVHSDALDFIIRAAKAAGYTCEGRVLNSADFGVPQLRERFFLVGFLGGHRFDFPAPTHRSPDSSDLFSAQMPRWVTTGDAISDLDQGRELPGHFAGGQHHDLLCQVPPGDNYLFFTKKRGHPTPKFRWRSRYWSFLLKLSPSLPSWTIQARRSNNMGPFHWRNRILTIDEVKRLQTFPDSWQLAGTIERQWRQLGNAVPPLLSAVLAQAIADKLNNKAKRKTKKRAL
jgi:DNA (cytosine-5)-methyltransferase 1